MKQLTFTLLMLQNFLSFSQPTVLQPGDIAIIGFNFKNPDEFSFISFVDLNPGTTIYFTDAGWKNDNTFRAGEGVVTYSVPLNEKISKRKVITYPSDPGFTTQGISGFFGFNVDGDQLFIFQGSYSNPTFLFGMDSSENPWTNDAIDNNSSKLPNELQSSGISVHFNKVINAVYDCNLATSLNSIDLINSVLNVSNWNTSPNRFTMPSSCFDNPLPIALSDFNVHKLNDGYQTSFHLNTDKNSMVYLEESENGVEFYKTDSLQALIGNQRYIFQHILLSNYYRLLIKSGSKEFYSEIKAVRSDKRKVLEIELYSIQGIQIYRASGSEIQNIQRIVAEPGVYLLKKLFEDGSFNVEKIIIDKDNPYQY